MRRLILATLLVGGVMSTGILTGSALMDSAWAQGAERYASLDTLAQALHHIERHFVDEATAQELIYGGIKGMTDTLDTHSTFLTPQEMKKAEARTEGWYPASVWSWAPRTRARSSTGSSRTARRTRSG